MIIGPKSSIHGVSAFISGLQRSCRGVLRVVADPGEGFGGMMSTAWLITDSLAVAPDFAVLSGGTSQIHVKLHEHAEPIRVQVLGAAPTGQQGSPVLLRLARTVPGHALDLNMQEVMPGERVLLLQHGAGRPSVHISFGRLTSLENDRLQYDADTEPGSSGAPVFREGDWKIIGMHVSSGGGNREWNEGLTVGEILEVLRQSEAWPEIAQHHKLANVAAAQVVLAGVVSQAGLGVALTVSQEDSGADAKSLLAAVVQWSFPPPEGKVAELLQPLVVDPEMPQWILRPEERERLALESGSLVRLQEARAALKKVPATPRQRVLDRILEGPPYDLDAEPEPDLPYWLQAVRWLGAMIPELPTAVQVNQNLERRRVRSRLETVAGSGFRGRIKELEKLRKWQENATSGPMVITGIGGVGKSALVSKFALDQEDGTVLLWLDFDRADLAPDDAVSVLNLLNEQMTLQISNYSAQAVRAEAWLSQTQELARVLAGQPAVLLVLDGFEVAQHVRQHQEIWALLNSLLEVAPRLRIIVSGRAPVPELTLGQRQAEALPLKGMAAADASAWLMDNGINDALVLSQVVELSKGVPLNLKLALYLFQEKGSEALDDLPGHLKAAMVEGFLYQRVLDRVIDPVLRPVAKDALILRRITLSVLQAVLADSLPYDMDVGEVFRRLQQELSLVDRQTGASTLAMGNTADVLYLRPEVRRATLQLLECDDPKRVREIDQRAAEWYAGQNLAEPSQAAELIYHRLRLGDLAGAKAAWRDDCIVFLEIDDLPETATKQRQWLHKKLQAASPNNSLLAWERESLGRIYQALRRNHLRILPDILGERSERSPGSPLVFYDVWSQWKTAISSSKPPQLEPLLESLNLNDAVDPGTHRDRLLLGALLHREAGNLAQADVMLAEASAESLWQDWPQKEIMALALMAARIRLTVDLEAEMELMQRLFSEKSGTESSKLPVTAADVLLPQLVQRFDSGWNVEVVSASLDIPKCENQLPDFNKRLHQVYKFDMPKVYWPEKGHSLDSMTAQAIAIQLRSMAEHRWRLAGSTLFLGSACEHSVSDNRGDELSLAVIATLAAFRGLDLRYEGRGGSYLNLDTVLERAVKPLFKQQVPPLRRRMAKAMHKTSQLLPMGKFADKWLGAAALARNWMGGVVLDEINAKRPEWQFIHEFKAPAMRSLALYVFSADPLETLCDHVAHPPEDRQSYVSPA